MAKPPPQIDNRSAKDIARQTEELLQLYATEWDEMDTGSNISTGFSSAMINIFARISLA